ncbi:MAG: hypothetical protein IT347_06815 [Candidatus Eisenbacteria bacterium]|nr:hypothetical protein [Candidatus Eisenbacteria bacterium]
MRALRRLLPLAVLATFGLAAGCGLKGTIRPNQAPETTLYVQGPVDTVNHVVHLYWFGTDVDGTISGYQIRLLNPADPAESAWVFTSRTDSLFTVFTPTGYTAPRFEVRALDNLNQVDPTPAVEDFHFSNQPPVVTLQQRPQPQDTTYASVTVTWNAGDVDGDPARMVFRVWLDGQAASPLTTTGRSFTMPSSRFTSGPYASRYRRLYVQAIDDGGMAGNVDSCTWYVRQAAPDSTQRARLLIVDDVPLTASGQGNQLNFRIDTLYSNTAARNLPAGSYSILRLQFTQPFASAADLEQTMRLFDAVVWYRANETSISGVLRTYGLDGIGAYLEAGGRFYLDGLYLFAGHNANGQLPDEFVTRYLNCRGLYQAFTTTIAFGQDSTIGWGNPNGSVFTDSTYLGSVRDSIRQQQLTPRQTEASGIRCFVQNNSSEGILWARPSSLTPAPPTAVPVAMSVPQPSGGRAVVVTVPIIPSAPIAGYNGAPRILAKIFQQLGLTGP